MVVVERVSGQWVKSEFQLDDMFVKSTEIWAVYNDEVLVALAGAIQETFLSQAKIWLILVNKIASHSLSFLRAMRAITAEARRRYSHGLLAVASAGVDEKFARFCGLRPVGTWRDYVRLEL